MRNWIYLIGSLLLFISIAACGGPESPEDFVARLSAAVASEDEEALWETFMDKQQLKQFMEAMPRMAGEPTDENVDQVWAAMNEDRGNQLRRYNRNFDLLWWNMQPDSIFLEEAPPEMIAVKNVTPAKLILTYREGDQQEQFGLSIVRFGNGKWQQFEYPDR